MEILKSVKLITKINSTLVDLIKKKKSNQMLILDSDRSDFTTMFFLFFFFFSINFSGSRITLDLLTHYDNSKIGDSLQTVVT